MLQIIKPRCWRCLWEPATSLDTGHKSTVTFQFGLLLPLWFNNNKSTLVIASFSSQTTLIYFLSNCAQCEAELAGKEGSGLTWSQSCQAGPLELCCPPRWLLSGGITSQHLEHSILSAGCFQEHWAPCCRSSSPKAHHRHKPTISDLCNSGKMPLCP